MALTTGERARYEPLLGLDLAAVRVHSGEGAARVAGEHRAHAFAYGSHIVLGHGAQHAGAHRRTRILAHELVHVGQQTGPPALRERHRSDLARAPPAAEAPQRPRERAPLGIQRLPDEDESILPAWVTTAATSVTEAGAAALETAAGLPGAAAEAALESAAAIVERLAPGLLEFLRGGAAGRLTELFCTAVDSVIGGLFARLGSIDLMAAIESTFHGLAEGVRGVQARLGAGATAALGAVLRPVVEALAVWSGPIVARVQEMSDSVNDVISAVWDDLAVPALDFLEGVGGAAWQAFNDLITWVWDVSEPLRRTAETAWNWLLGQFNLAWDSTAGIRATLAEYAAGAWSSFLEAIEPIKTPLMVAGGILLLLSPLGPIVVLTQVVPPLWEKLVWLWNSWNSEDILVWARDVLKETILPGIIGTVSGIAGAFADGAAWLAGVVGTLGTALSGVFGAFGGSRCLRAATTYLEGVSDQFRRLAAWANSGFEGLAPALSAVFDALVAIFEPILDFLVRLTMVALNPGMLPFALAAAIWLWCPRDLKPPVINFVYDLLIAFLDGLPSILLGLGALGPVMKAAMLGYLRHMRGGPGVTDEVRIDVSNKVAGIIAGGGLEFMAGFALGLLHGLIDGIIDPFRLIWLLMKVLIMAAQVIGQVLAPYLEANVPGYAGAIEAAGGSPATLVVTGSPRGPPAPEGHLRAQAPAPEPGAEPTDADIAAALSPATIAEFSGAGAEPVPDEAALAGQAREEVEGAGATVEGLAGLLGGVWDAILDGAAGLGAAIGGALIEWILQPDFEVGRQLGFVAGFILLQALVIYFTAGGYGVLKGGESGLRVAFSYLLRFLDLGGEIMGLLGKALRPLLGPIRAGLRGVSGFMNRFGFARGMAEAIERWALRLERFADDAARVAPEGAAGRGAQEAVEEAGERGARETAEEAGERGARETAEEAGERGAREAAEGAPVRAADDLGPGGLRAADEPGVPTIRDDAARAAQELAAVGAAVAIAEANDAIGTPVPAVLTLLMVLKRQYRWIDTFTARMVRPGVYRLELVASPGTPVDTNYTPAAVTLDDVRARLPGVPIDARSALRLQAVDNLNALPPGVRDELLDAMARMDPDEAGRTLTALGRLDPADVVARARAAELRAGGLEAPEHLSGGPLPEGTQASGPRTSQRIAEASAADVLAANLTRELGTRPPGHHAHHIVPKGMEAAQEARDILARADIGINDGPNGAWLPRDTAVVNVLAGDIHSRIHTRRYVRWMTELLREAEEEGGPEAVRRTLRAIRALVASGDAVT